MPIVDETLASVAIDFSGRAALRCANIKFRPATLATCKPSCSKTSFAGLRRPRRLTFTCG